MFRIGALFFLLLTCGRLFADVSVELDVAFGDSAIYCRYLYVLCPAANGTNDTLAVFDTLSFNGQNRVSLFYSVRSGCKNTLLLVDSAGVQLASNPFRISPRRTTFAVVVGRQQITVSGKTYLNYLFWFLIILLAEYLLIALVCRKSISWLRAALLVLLVNMAAFGIIVFLYLLYVFW